MNKTLKRTFVALFSAFMVTPTAVMAEGESDPNKARKVTTSVGTIDPSMKGSITLYKYIDNNGVSADADGVALGDNADSMEAAIRQKLNDQDIFPEKGVRFKLLKVADIEQVTNNHTDKSNFNVTGTYYTNLDSEFYTTMNKYLGSSALTPSNSTATTDDRQAAEKKHYESDELNDKLLRVNRMSAASDGTPLKGEVALNRIVRQRNETTNNKGYCKEFDLTTDQGFTSLNDLPLGLYLIAEVDYEHSSLSKHDNYWEYVPDNYDDQLGEGNTGATAANQGKTEDAEVSTDDGYRQTRQDGAQRNSSTSAGKDAGGSSYADIVSPCSPFLISVPTTNTTNVIGSDGQNHEAGTVWQYDITAYPKNGTLTIHKDIVVNSYANHGRQDAADMNDGNDDESTETICDFNQTNYTKNGKNSKLNGGESNGLTHQIDANIGDIITQLVSVDVPRLVDDIDDEQDSDNAEHNTKNGTSTNDNSRPNHTNAYRKHNAKFVVTDRMTKGLSLIDYDPSHFVVKLSQGTWLDAGTTLALNVDYTVEFAKDRKSYVLTMTPSGLNKLDDIPAASYLYIKYDTVLTKDALIGTDTYGNEVTIKNNGNTAAAKDEDNVNTRRINDSNEGTNNQGVTEQQIKNGEDVDVENHAEGGHYDSTYKTGPTKSETTTVEHADATNQNTAELTYATDRTQEHDYYSNTVKVFTYELDLTKLFTDGTQGNVSKHDTSTADNGTKGNNKEFDYSKVKFTVRGSTRPASRDGQLAAQKNADGSVNHAYGYNSIPVNDIDKNNKQRTGADSNTNVWEQMLFIKTGDGTYRVWDPLTDGNVQVDQTNQVTSLDTAYNGKAAIDTTQAYTTAGSAVGTVSKYLIPNSKTGLLTVKGLDSRDYEFTEVSTAPGRNLMADCFYVEIVAPKPAGVTERSEPKLENGQVAHAYVWTGNKPININDYDIANFNKTKARLDIGRVPLTVQNNEVIKVLKTGGKGIWIYAGVGIGIIALGAVLLHKKPQDNSPEDQKA